METQSYVEQVFQHLHQIPEKKFQEYQTSQFIENELKKFGYAVESGVAETGIIARMDSQVEGPTLALRADMDSLPYVIDGEHVDIHACGHDAHSSMVLGTAKAIAETGIKKGQIVFLFQPAEETLEGAIGMVESGKLNDLTEIVGIHLRPIQDTPLGQACPGIYHTACHRIRLKIQGKPAHSARPHLGINTIEAAVLAIGAVNAIKINPELSASVKATNIRSGEGADNVIPESTEIVFDFRAESDEAMADLRQKAEKAMLGSVESIGASATIEFMGSSPCAEYDDEMIEVAIEAIEERLGQSLPPMPTAGSEDFHYFTKKLKLKSAYLGLGADLTPGLHHPEMRFDQRALEHGRAILQSIVHKRLG